MNKETPKSKKPKTVKQPKTKIDYKDRDKHVVYETRIVQTSANSYRIDGNIKKFFNLLNHWVVLTSGDYDKRSVATLTRAKEVQNNWLKYYQNKFDYVDKYNIVLDSDVLKSKKTHPEYYV